MDIELGRVSQHYRGMQHCERTQSATRLVQTAKHVTRDLNPNDDLKNLRIKTSKKELIVSHNKDFNVIVIQAWTPAKDDPSHLVQQQVAASLNSTTTK